MTPFQRARLRRFVHRTPRQHYWVAKRVARQQLQAVQASVQYRLARHLRWKFAAGRRRTAYVVGLFGTGRWYINDLILEHVGPRKEYFKDTIVLRAHPAPTALIYSGHATLKYASRFQALPSVTARVLESARAGVADLIFVYRHPLDSLLTNWVWWRTFVREQRVISGISQVYRSTDALCADLEGSFAEFQAFATAAEDSIAAGPGERFLSLAEFVEETALFIDSATLALRLEDFTTDPRREFSKVLQLLCAEADASRLEVAPPLTRPYRYRAVAEKVPRFKGFIDTLDAGTRARIAAFGYELGA
jgi:hypothetical protein